AVVLQFLHDSQTLLIVIETARNEIGEHAFPCMPERRVPKVVAERDRFRQLLVQQKHLRDRPRHLRHLQRVREPRAVVIAGGREEYLRLVLETPERLAVNDAVAIALECRPDVVFGFRAHPSLGVGAFRSLWRQGVALTLFERLTNGAQRCPPGSWCRVQEGRRRSWP